VIVRLTADETRNGDQASSKSSQPSNFSLCASAQRLISSAFRRGVPSSSRNSQPHFEQRYAGIGLDFQLVVARLAEDGEQLGSWQDGQALHVQADAGPQHMPPNGSL